MLKTSLNMAGEENSLPDLFQTSKLIAILPSSSFPILNMIKPDILA